MISKDLKALLPALPRLSSPAALKVLVVLAAHADRQGRCWLSWTRIARLAGLSRRAVADGLRRLEEAGLVKRVGSAPRGRGTMYQLGPAGGEPACTRCTTVHQGGAQPCTGVVHGRAPIAEVHAGAPSEGRNPRRTGILGQAPGQLGGEQPCTIEGEGNTEKVSEGARPTASGPPALTGASGPEASGPEEDGFTLWFHFEDGVVSVTPITAERAEIGFWMDGMSESARVAGPALDPRTWRGLLQAVPPRFAAQAREVLPAVQAGLRRWLAAEENRRCWTSWAEENRRERLAEQLVEQLLGSAPYDEELQGLLVGAEDLVRLRDHLQRTRPDLVEAFRKTAVSAFGGPDRFKAAWQDALRGGVGYCHSRAWGLIAIVPGQVRGLTDAVLQAWAGILGAAPPGPSSERPPQQALQAAGPLHEVVR